jgi:hypothetical protein
MLIFYYKTQWIAERLEAPDSTETLDNNLEIARLCAAACILERCYTSRAKTHNTDEALPLFLYRQVMSYARVITRGQLETVMRVYQDLIRVRTKVDGVKTVYCAHRVG